MPSEQLYALKLDKMLFVLAVIDGGFTEWSPGPCSATCGKGTRIETRACSNPAPRNGGMECQGEFQRRVACSTGISCENDHLLTKCFRGPRAAG